MRTLAIKFTVSLVAMPLSLVLAGMSSNGIFYIPFFVSMPFAVLYWIEFSKALRRDCLPGSFAWAFGMVMGVPEALMGGICCLMGIAIVAWVLYNFFNEKHVAFKQLFISLGVGPTLFFFGLKLVRNAFHGESDEEDEEDEKQDEDEPHEEDKGEDNDYEKVNNGKNMGK